MHTSATALGRSEVNLWESVLSLCLAGSGDPAQAIRFGTGALTLLFLFFETQFLCVALASWNSPCGAGWFESQRSPSVGTTGVCHTALLMPRPTTDLLSYFFEAGPHWDLGLADLTRPAGQAAPESSCTRLPCAGLQGLLLCVASYLATGF